VGSNPDVLYVVAAFDESPATLIFDENEGETLLSLTSGSATYFSYAPRTIVCIGGTELARVTSVDAQSDSIGISTHPSNNGVGLNRDFKSGTPVEIVKVIKYTCSSTGSGFFLGRPYLAREEITTASQPFNFIHILTMGIEDLQVQMLPEGTHVSITSRAKKTDSRYVNPDHDDHYRRTTYSSRAYSRN